MKSKDEKTLRFLYPNKLDFIKSTLRLWLNMRNILLLYN
jgi:hypothetical protein